VIKEQAVHMPNMNSDTISSTLLDSKFKWLYITQDHTESGLAELGILRVFTAKLYGF
jgi:hypothetical protein